MRFLKEARTSRVYKVAARGSFRRSSLDRPKRHFFLKFCSSVFFSHVPSRPLLSLRPLSKSASEIEEKLSGAETTRSGTWGTLVVPARGRAHGPAHFPTVRQSVHVRNLWVLGTVTNSASTNSALTGEGFCPKRYRKNAQRPLSRREARAGGPLCPSRAVLTLTLSLSLILRKYSPESWGGEKKKVWRTRET